MVKTIADFITPSSLRQRNQNHFADLAQSRSDQQGDRAFSSLPKQKGFRDSNSTDSRPMAILRVLFADNRPCSVSGTVVKQREEWLNQEYVDAFINTDVDWYREHLADDFICIESYGSVLNKAQFLTNTARGPDVADYELQEVDVRVYLDAALARDRSLEQENGATGEDGLCADYSDIDGEASRTL